jgi:hypothetical protein
MRNPFGATKANDLDDAQIQELWVDVLKVDDELGIFAHPNGFMPTFVLGAKGSGKTHLMRYHSFELQLLRYGDDASQATVHAGVKRDGYIGIYALWGSINANRFQGKGQTAEAWRALFAYYLELWLGHHLIHIVKQLKLSPKQEMAVVEQARDLFDREPLGAEFNSLDDLSKTLGALQRELDFAITNAVLSGKIEIEIYITTGKLLFGLPKILSEQVSFLRAVVFLYCIDEFEMLSVDQQEVVNSLVRDKAPPSTLRIGSRLYGIKTQRTDGGLEENLNNSEYRQLVLDSRFRLHKDRYVEFAKTLVQRRMLAAFGAGIDVGRLFESLDDSWDSARFRSLVPAQPAEREHFRRLRSKFAGAEVSADEVISLLSCESYPVLEKLNVLLLYQMITKGKAVERSAAEIAQSCAVFVEGEKRKSRYKQALDHYKSDLIAQLSRENGGKQFYLGLDTFIAMSAGLPRALLTTLRTIFEWSIFHGEDPIKEKRVSVDAQYRGVRDASGWFFDYMRKAGDDGKSIQSSITRLAQLFRINRFAERPIEVSLSAFSVDANIGSESARRVLRLAEERSFLVAVPDGGRDKNSGDPLLKFQLSPMLAPRWDLPIFRRGAVTLSEMEFESVFGEDLELFAKVQAEWIARTSVRFGKSAKHDGQPSLI